MTLHHIVDGITKEYTYEEEVAIKEEWMLNDLKRIEEDKHKEIKDNIKKEALRKVQASLGLSDEEFLSLRLS